MRLLPTARLIRQKYLSGTSKRSLVTTSNATRTGNTQERGGGVWLEANPRICLHDVHTALSVGGLLPLAPVTLKASLIDEKGKHFSSNGHFITDENGKVDLERATSVGGSYKGVFPAGLLTTLSAAPNEHRHYRLFRRDTQTPWKITVSVTDGHVDLNTNQDALAKVELERHLMAPGTRRIPVRSGLVRGALYLPPGSGPFPGIIDMFGFVGGLYEFRSAMLASRGFASLALAVFDYDDLPKAPDNLHFEYFEEAIQFLLSQPEVIPDRCGTVVNSKSGDIGYNMGILFEPVKAVIGINALTYPMYTQYYYRGKPYVKGIAISDELQRMDEQGASYVDFSHYFNNDFPHMIPVENADDDTHFMVVCGDDDPYGFACSIKPFQERMERNNKTNYETILYPGAGHLIQPPYDSLVPNMFQKMFLKSGTAEGYVGVTLKWGGTPQGTCDAQVDLWQRMHAFFNKHVRDESPWFQKHLQTSYLNSKTFR